MIPSFPQASILSLESIRNHSNFTIYRTGACCHMLFDLVKMSASCRRFWLLGMKFRRYRQKNFHFSLFYCLMPVLSMEIFTRVSAVLSPWPGIGCVYDPLLFKNPKNIRNSFLNLAGSSWLKKINTVGRLSRHLAKGTPNHALNAYLALIKKWTPAQPVSPFSKIHSSKEKDFTSVNSVTFSAMGQDYVIRLTARRKLLYHNKWVSATELRNILWCLQQTRKSNQSRYSGLKISGFGILK